MFCGTTLRKTLIQLACATVVALFAGSPVFAAPITIQFSALLDTSGPKPPGVSTGDVVIGTIVFDLDEIGSQFNDADDGGYGFNPGTSSFSFSVGSFSRSAEITGIQLNNSFVDVIEITALPTPLEQWYIRLVDVSASAWNTTFLENIPVSTLTNLSLFNANPNDIRLFDYGDFNPGGSRLSGEIFTLAGEASTGGGIPEPGALALLLCGLFGAMLMTSRAIRNPVNA